ncbi:MAG TPA: hypothetical protein VHW44_27205 [Pseudonocardiaceae bacterium]|nr:hypothetical protein [Pseudonocardiaceae bacterium]
MSLDESVSWRVLYSLWLRAFVIAFVVWFVFFALAAIIGLFSLISSASDSGAADPYGISSSGSSGGGGFGAAVVVFVIGSLIAFVLFWIIALFSKLPEPIAEWRVLQAGRGDKAESVYSQISGTLMRRRLPVQWGVRRIRTGFGSGNVSNRLVLVERSYTAYVSVFAYGSSLYLGWMMWRSRRGTALIRQFLSDVGQGLLGRGDPERRMMRTEPARAMREAVHAACREGLFVAVEGRDVPLSYGFPQGLPPVESGDSLDNGPVPGFAEQSFPAGVGQP